VSFVAPVRDEPSHRLRGMPQSESMRCDESHIKVRPGRSMNYHMWSHPLRTAEHCAQLGRVGAVPKASIVLHRANTSSIHRILKEVSSLYLVGLGTIRLKWSRRTTWALVKLEDVSTRGGLNGRNNMHEVPRARLRAGAPHADRPEQQAHRRSMRELREVSWTPPVARRLRP